MLKIFKDVANFPYNKKIKALGVTHYDAYLSDGQNVKVIPGEGNWNPDRFIILEWESIDAFQNFINSEEYLEIKDLRMNSSTSKSLLVEEYLKN